MTRENEYRVALEDISNFCVNFQINELQQKDMVLHHIWEMCYEVLKEE